MAASRKKLRTLTDFCLDSGTGDEGLPDYFRLLGEWVGCDHGAFFQTEANGLPCGVFHEDMQHREQAAAFIQHEQGPGGRSALFPVMTDLFRPGTPVQHLSFASAAARETALFRDIISQIGGREVLRVGVQVGGRPLGMVALVRGAGVGSFTADDAKRLTETVQPLAALLVRPPESRQRQLLSEGVLLLDADGRIAHACAEGLRLLRLMQHQLSPSTLQLQPFLQSLSHELTAATANPVMQKTVANSWGHFELQASRLLRPDASASGLLHLRLQHWRLASLQQWRRMETIGLSSAQKRVCLALLEDKSQSLIADELGISLQTAISHIRQVYNRAGVSTRRDLLPLFRL